MHPAVLFAAAYGSDRAAWLLRHREALGDAFTRLAGPVTTALTDPAAALDRVGAALVFRRDGREEVVGLLTGTRSPWTGVLSRTAVPRSEHAVRARTFSGTRSLRPGRSEGTRRPRPRPRLLRSSKAENQQRYAQWTMNHAIPNATPLSTSKSDDPMAADDKPDPGVLRPALPAVRSRSTISWIALGSLLVIGAGGAVVFAPTLFKAASRGTAAHDARAGAPVASVKRLDVRVDVATPVEREVVDTLDFAARLAAINYVEVRAHVWGYLDRVNFHEGAMVNKGDVLFELDARIYENQLRQANALVAQAEARLRFDEQEVSRLNRMTNAMSRSELDKAISTRDLDRANLEQAQEAAKLSQLNLGYSKIAAAVSGRIGRCNVTVGNLVQSGDQSGGTLLTTIVSVDPIYAYFDVDEGAVLRNLSLTRDGKAKPFRELGTKVVLRLGDGGRFSRPGTIDFVDNQINPKTGTLRMRASLGNPDEALTPGMFATVTLPIGNRHKALLVRESAIDSDQGQRVLCVLNGNNIVERRRVAVGDKHDGLVEVGAGLRPGEKVIVKGVQLAQAGLQVDGDMQNPVTMSEGAVAEDPARKEAGRKEAKSE